ncbi:hypothetical protein B0T17DRAFT_121364 [Bombardia bombarda]|uniref:Uncharacterized protein n=1 Tax=Bombardia bombarda TaxID=252184 RepID=A0AA39WBU1_9PEZI|nr:hypothetical protein B0T17DRAFT_121364 [Bombardia bombarda]
MDDCGSVARLKAITRKRLVVQGGWIILVTLKNQKMCVAVSFLEYSEHSRNLELAGRRVAQPKPDDGRQCLGLKHRSCLPHSSWGETRTDQVETEVTMSSRCRRRTSVFLPFLLESPESPRTCPA